MKRTLAIVLSVISFHLWASTETVNGYTWTYRVDGCAAEIYNDGKVAISPRPFSSPANLPCEVDIPQTLGGMPVVSIGASAFKGCTGITSVTMPNTVTNISSSAFEECRSLTEIGIGNNVRRIGGGAFKYCTNLTSVSIPSSVINIGGSVFYGCRSLSSIDVDANNAKYSSVNGLLLSKNGSVLIAGVNGEVTIPNAVTIIGAGAFGGCDRLTKVVIPKSVKRIDEQAFNSCRELSDVTIPSSVTRVDSSAFDHCSGLRSLTIPQCVCDSRLRVVFSSAYSSITNVVLQDGVTSISPGAFMNCSNLVSVIMPESLTRIGFSAFEGCGSLSDIIIPNSVVEIGSNAFIGCNSSLFDDATIPGVKLVDSWVVGHSENVSGSLDLTGARGISAASFVDCTNLTSVTIPMTITGIGSSAFQGCNRLASVTIPDGVVIIGGSAFLGCSRLSNVSIPDSVVSIGLSAFSECNELLYDTVTVPGVKIVDGWAVGYMDSIRSNLNLNGVRGIGTSAFCDCNRIYNVTIPDSVVSIGGAAFIYCSQLRNVEMPDTLSMIGDDAFFKCSNLTSVFFKCSSLTSATVPKSALEIGADAFYQCNRISSVYIEDISKWCNISFAGSRSNPVSYAHDLYYDETLLKNIAIPATVTEIGPLVFGWCSSLEEVFIPSTVSNIDNSAFYYCNNLRSINVAPDNENYSSIDGQLLTKDAKFLLRGNGINGEAKIPDSVVIVGRMSFAGCSEISNVVFNDSLEIIDEYAFQGCTALTKVVIPDSVISIGTDAFSGCTGLEAIYLSPDYMGRTDIFPSTAEVRRFKKTQVVTFDVSDGSVSPLTKSADYGHAYGELPIPSREGYAFVGWEFNGNIIDSETVVAAVDDHVITAKWRPNSYTITFDANGGHDSVCIVQEFGAQLCIPLLIREGYSLEGWDPAVPQTVPAGDVTYAARWKINQYTISFDSVGGSAMFPITQDYATPVTSPVNPTKAGHRFVGWTPSVPVSMPASNMTCTAQWRINQYTISFDSAGGTGVSPIIQDYATAITPPENPTRTGYTFMGWTPSVPSTMPDANTTCVAQWKINQYTISFDSDCGIPVSPITQDYATAITPPESPTKSGYTFMGWSPSVPAAMPASSMTCTAQWQANKYTVTFDANGGTVSPGSKVVTFDDVYGVLPIPSLDYCTFIGWRLGNKPVAEAEIVSTASDHTLVSQWSRYGAELTASQVAGKKLRELYPDDYANMTTVVLKNGITALPKGFFDGCDNVVNLTLPESLLEFGIDDLPSKIRTTLAYDENGFMIYGNWILDYQNRSAMEVTIPDGIVGIGRGAFAAMFDLETVTMPESLRRIAKGAFEDCSWIQDLQFMSGLRYVGPVAFRGCSSLLRATFADGVENLGTNVFEDCWKMQSVRLPFTVTNIGVRAFYGCSAIRGVTVPTQVETMQTLFPVAYTKIETAEVAEGETAVMNDMFKGCTALRGGATQTDMSMIPNTVTNIGARAFQGCTSLTEFVVPDSVTEIGEAVFLGCTSLRNVTLSRNLAAISDKAFYGCSMLETMVVPQRVNYLGSQFFCGKDNGSNALYYLCTNAPAYHASAYSAITGNMTTYVEQGSRGWDGRVGSRVLPQLWNGYPITYWTPNRFDVTFDANGGRFELADGSAYSWSEQQITDTGYALPSTEPIRPGWAFEGWWTEQYGGAEVRYTTLVTATRTHTLYAHWRLLGEGMTVTFNSNGGTVVVPGSQDYVSGQTFGQFPVPTRRGYAFQGWWTESVDGVHVTEATQVPAADMELFAHWSPITYVVRFHANGGNGGDVDQTFVFDVQRTLASHTFTRTGFAFTGWATTPSGQVRYAENASVVNLEEVQDKVVDLYAVWSGVGYSVRFDSNGGNGIMDNQTIAVGETQNLWPCVFARGGYSFAGWALSPTDAANGTVKYRDGAAVKNLATSNGATVQLYAVWFSSDQTVRVSFDANGGSVSPDYWDCLMGTAVEAFPTATRPGFTFSGWWTAKTGGMEVESIAVVSDARTFYAHWAENGEVNPGDWSCTVSFNANGGSVTETSRIVGSGATVGMLPAPIRMGFVFTAARTTRSGRTPDCRGPEAAGDPPPRGSPRAGAARLQRPRPGPWRGQADARTRPCAPARRAPAPVRRPRPGRCTPTAS